MLYIVLKKHNTALHLILLHKSLNLLRGIEIFHRAQR